MGLSEIILKNGEESRVTNFYNHPDSLNSIQFYLNREPSFFEALQAEGDDSLVYAVIDDESNQVAGSYIRSTRECFINGHPEKVTYIGSMKIHAQHRGGWTFFKMLRHMQKNNAHDKRLHYFSVMESNEQAANLFLSGRPMLPVVKEVGSFTTRVFKPFRKKINPPFEIISASQAGIEPLVAFLNSEGARKQLFPVYREKHFTDSSLGWLKGLSADDIMVAVHNNKIIGTLAVWDQGAYRRWMLYRSQAFKIIQPFINMYSFVKGMPAIPSGHQAVACRYLSLISIKNDNTDVFQNLLCHAMNRELDKQSQALFILGNINHDPMYAPFTFPALKLNSKIGCFTWQQHASFLHSIPFDQTYIETGAL
jgi:hypothetical protein